jgi:hypothetical protein
MPSRAIKSGKHLYLHSGELSGRLWTPRRSPQNQSQSALMPCGSCRPQILKSSRRLW